MLVLARRADGRIIIEGVGGHGALRGRAGKDGGTVSATTAVKELPIPFKAPMIQAIRAGRKSMTRRVMRRQPERHGDRMRWCPPGAKYDAKLDMWVPSCEWDASRPVMETGAASIVEHCPHGKPGDRLWVKEAWALVACASGCDKYPDGFDPIKPSVLQRNAPREGVCYRATWTKSRPGRWRPSIHMPRWASRILLEITDVRVERLQDVSEADAMAEGFASVADFGEAWSRMYGLESMYSDPWLWVVSFRVLEGLA